MSGRKKSSGSDPFSSGHCCSHHRTILFLCNCLVNNQRGCQKGLDIIRKWNPFGQCRSCFEEVLRGTNGKRGSLLHRLSDYKVSKINLKRNLSEQDVILKKIALTVKPVEKKLRWF